MGDTTAEIQPKLDKTPLGHFGKELQTDIDNQKVFEDGWEIKVRRYNIPWMGYNAHTTIELHGPKRDDGTHFYADIDTFSMNNKGEATFYTPGSEMRMAVDQNRADNWVVTDENMLQDLSLARGTGTEMLLRFTRMAEQVQEFNASGAQYHPFSWDGYLGLGKEEWANSNSGPVQILENLGYDVHDVDGIDLRYNEVNTGYVIDHDIPGADDPIPSLFQQQEPGFFESFNGDPSALVTNDQLKRQVIDLFTSLHPDYIAKTDPEMGGAAPAATPLKPR